MTLSLSDMFQCGLHFGHQTRYWNPKMAPYIYGKAGKIHLHDLTQTLTQYDKALTLMKNIASHRGTIIFVGTKAVARDLVQHHASACGMPYVDQRWLGGTLTNYKTIRLRMRYLQELEKQSEKNQFDDLTKKERLMLARKQTKLQASIGGIRHMRSLPEALFVLDVKQDAIAVREANCLGIPVIGLVDTNASPEGIDHVIPGNDDSYKGLAYLLKHASDVINAERKKHEASDTKKHVSSKKVVVTRKSSSRKPSSKESAS